MFQKCPFCQKYKTDNWGHMKRHLNCCYNKKNHTALVVQCWSCFEKISFDKFASHLEKSHGREERMGIVSSTSYERINTDISNDSNIESQIEMRHETCDRNDDHNDFLESGSELEDLVDTSMTHEISGGSGSENNIHSEDDFIDQNLVCDNNELDNESLNLEEAESEVEFLSSNENDLKTLLNQIEHDENFKAILEFYHQLQQMNITHEQYVNLLQTKVLKSSAYYQYLPKSLSGLNKYISRGPESVNH
jgi:hypothetical protein